MSWIEIIAERRIQEADAEGAFIDVPGSGRPLELDRDARQPPEVRLAHRLMKEAGVLPEWIQLDREIRVRREAWIEHSRRFEEDWRERIASLPAMQAGVEEERRLLRERAHFLVRSVVELNELRSIVQRFNLLVPIVSRQRFPVPVEAWMEALELRLPLPPGREASTVGAEWREHLPPRPGPLRLGNRMPLRRKQPIG